MSKWKTLCLEIGAYDDCMLILSCYYEKHMLKRCVCKFLEGLKWNKYKFWSPHAKCEDVWIKNYRMYLKMGLAMILWKFQLCPRSNSFPSLDMRVKWLVWLIFSSLSLQPLSPRTHTSEKHTHTFHCALFLP